MYRIAFAALAVAAWLGWGLPIAAGQQQEPSPSGAAGGAGGTGTSTGLQTSGTAAAGTATADPAKIQTYVQMRKFLQSQVVSMERPDVSADREVISKLLASQSRQWMSPEEFFEFHKQVESDPALKAQVQAAMRQGGTSGTAAPSGAEPSASPK